MPAPEISLTVAPKNIPQAIPLQVSSTHQGRTYCTLFKEYLPHVGFTTVIVAGTAICCIAYATSSSDSIQSKLSRASGFILLGAGLLGNLSHYYARRERRESIAEIQEERFLLQQENASLKSENQTLHKNVLDLKTTLSEFHKERVALQTEVDTFSQENRDLSLRVHDFEEAAAHLSKEVLSFEEQNKELKAILTAEKRDAGAVAEQTKKTTDAMRNLTEQIKTAKELVANVLEWNKDLGILIKKVASLLDQVQVSENHITELVQKMEKAQEREEKIQARILARWPTGEKSPPSEAISPPRSAVPPSAPNQLGEEPSYSV